MEREAIILPKNESPPDEFKADREVYVYDAGTGAFGTKLSSSAEVGNESGWIDIRYALRAYRRVNGEYVVEEDAKAKVIMYRLGQDRERKAS